MLDIKNIEALLEKYWNAETNEAEEALLKAYFSSDNVHTDVAYAVSYFKKNTASDADINTIIVTKLVDKYFEGETSVDEEAIIKEYFNQDTIASSLRQYKSMFNAFANEAKVTYDKPLEIKKEAKIVSLRQASDNKEIETVQKGKVVGFKWARVAAAAAFIGISGYFINKNMIETASPVKTAMAAKHIEPETPEEALEVTMQALAMVSRKYKKGEQQLFEGMKTMNESNIIKE
jgi:hypothetical protein